MMIPEEGLRIDSHHVYIVCCLGTVVLGSSVVEIERHDPSEVEINQSQYMYHDFYNGGCGVEWMIMISSAPPE